MLKLPEKPVIISKHVIENVIKVEVEVMFETTSASTRTEEVVIFECLVLGPLCSEHVVLTPFLIIGEDVVG